MDQAEVTAALSADRLWVEMRVMDKGWKERGGEERRGEGRKVRMEVPVDRTAPLYGGGGRRSAQ